jgi:uncharacterized protein (DUF305 family)
MRTRPTRLTAAGLTLALALTGCANADTTTTTASSTAPAAASPASTADAADIAFAQLMIPHHQQALAMATMAQAAATSPDVKALADQIEAAQDPEIAQMTGWLQAWGAPTAMPGAGSAEDMAGMDHGGMDMGGMTGAGMMTAEQMDALAQATGPDFDRMWLQMMIAHHQGAITMAEQVLTTTSNPEVRTLAQAVVDGQTAEIATMQQLLAGSAG